MNNNEVNIDNILESLLPTSTTKERLDAIVKCGLSSFVIARSIGVSESSLRNWNIEASRPRSDSSKSLDNMRTVMLYLIQQGGLHPERAAQWMSSREEVPPFEKPIDIIANNPEKVFELATRSIEALKGRTQE
jgi:DNA-binding transcriptional regulator YiaG